MKSPASPKQTPSFNLLLGLTIALAVVLCAFEHGYPPQDDHRFKGLIDEDPWSSEEELPPITKVRDLPDPPKIIDKQKVVTASFTPKFELLPSDAPDPTDLPEFDMGDIDNIVPIEVAVAPAIKPFDFVDQMPEFPGGDEALMKFLKDNLKYPGIAKDNNIQGDFYIRFVIDAKGEVRVDSFDVYRPVHPALTQEAIRVIKMMPDWKPGRQGPRNVPVYVNLPVSFKIK